MQVRYLKPVPVEIPLTAKGTITSEGKSRTCKAEAVLLDGEGNVLAKSEGDFAVLSSEKLTVLPEDYKNAGTFRKV